jgi:hypothetical protein
LGTSKAKARPEGLDAKTPEKLIASMFVSFGAIMISAETEVEHNYLAK